MLEQFLLTTYIKSEYHYFKYSHSGNPITTTNFAEEIRIARKHFVIVQACKTLNLGERVGLTAPL